MTNAIAKLKKEHGNFRKLLSLLETQLYLFHRGEQPDYQLMTDILHYMTSYPDRFHHPKEDMIFSCLSERDSRVAQSVEELARQHHVIATSGADLHEKLKSVIMEAFLPRQAVETPGLLYINFYRTHMDKEESELFELAEQLLSADDWKKIEAEIHAEPDPLFGTNIDERYCAVCSHITQAVDESHAS